MLLFQFIILSLALFFLFNLVTSTLSFHSHLSAQLKDTTFLFGFYICFFFPPFCFIFFLTIHKHVFQFSVHLFFNIYWSSRMRLSQVYIHAFHSSPASPLASYLPLHLTHPVAAWVSLSCLFPFINLPFSSFSALLISKASTPPPPTPAKHLDDSWLPTGAHSDALLQSAVRGSAPALDCVPKLHSIIIFIILWMGSKISSSSSLWPFLFYFLLQIGHSLPHTAPISNHLTGRQHQSILFPSYLDWFIVMGLLLGGPYLVICER